jgi:outer membrane lipoprotein-sorting protein
MKKIKTLLIALSILGCGVAEAQTKSIRSAQTEPEWIATTSSNYTSINEAKTIVAQIISVVGLKANFELRAANIPNAAAVVYNGKRYVMYNPTFIASMNKSAGTKWAGISILAHEIGHHLNGHTIEHIGSHPAIELEADEFSGFVLRRMGASLTDAQQAMRIAADYKQSKTHPAKNDRLLAIASGWNNADDQAKGKQTDVAKTTAPVKMTTPVTAPTTSTTGIDRRSSDPSRVDPRSTAGHTTRTDVRTASRSTGIDERFILGDVSFAGDAAGTYYVTSRYNLVKVTEDEELLVLGKITSGTSEDYPYIVNLVNNQRLWVSSGGTIFNSKGFKVGVMKSR